MTAKHAWRLAIALMLVGAAGAHGQEVGVGDAANIVLQATARQYSALPRYKARVALTMTRTDGVRTQSESATLLFRLEKPNRLRARFRTRGEDYTIVSDGQKLWTHYSITNKYMVQPAPAEVHQVFDSRTHVSFVMGMGRVVFGPFAKDPYAVLLNKARGARFVGKEKLDDVQVDHVAVELRAGVMDLYIDSANQQLRKATMTVLSPTNPKAKIVVEAAMDESHRDIEQMPEGFTFEPGEGAREVGTIQDMVNPVGGKAQPFEVEGLEEGSTFRLGEHGGKVIMLDFWASWCGPCRMELPMLADIYKDYKDKGFLLVAVNVGEDRAAAAEFMEDQGLDVPVVLDTDGSVGGMYHVVAIPTVVLIGRDGTVEAVHQGYSPNVDKDLRKELDVLLEGGTLQE